MSLPPSLWWGVGILSSPGGGEARHPKIVTQLRRQGEVTQAVGHHRLWHEPRPNPTQPAVAIPPPPFAQARPCLSTGWALNRRFEEILGPLFLWSRMEDWVFVERLYRERGAQSCL